MSISNIKSVLQSNELVQSELNKLKKDLIQRTDRLHDRIVEQAKEENEPTRDWRVVEPITNSDRYPLVKADITKLLNII